ncbi:uncharacterized protein BDR25DRAFT_171056, partial [Lindgomyces ingoldianus]
IPLTAAAAHSPIPLAVRNNIYSALMSGHGIASIQATLTHELQSSGWISDLRSYITYLLRSGECTTVSEVMERVMAECKLRPALEMSNGLSNGVNGANGHKETDDINLRLPERAVREGVRVVRRELDKVCDITVE